MNQQNSNDYSKLWLTIFCCLAITFAAQINVSLYLNNFKISIAVILFPIFLFFWDRFPLMWVTFLSGIAVFLSRCGVQLLSEGVGADLYSSFLPEAFFYFVYGTLLFLLHKKSQCNKTLRGLHKGGDKDAIVSQSHLTSFLVLVCIDYAANLTELLLRVGTDAFVLPSQTGIVLAALFRSGAALLILAALKHSHLLLLKREHAKRYQNLLLLISKLNGEVIWMKKNTSLIEEAMNASYQLYKDLSAQNISKEVTTRALQTARDIHEIKKEYFIILRGISEALDLNLNDEGMYVKNLLMLLSDTFLTACKADGLLLKIETKCRSDLFTDKHYFLLSIFHNLYTNAVEACSDLPLIQITCTQLETDANYCFVIEDNGHGLTDEGLENLFLPGYSTKINYQTGQISRGLGLNLVQDLVENHFHGTISVCSEPGCTTFTIMIPKSELKVVS